MIKKCRFCGLVMHRVIEPCTTYPGSYSTWWECAQGHRTRAKLERNLGETQVVSELKEESVEK